VGAGVESWASGWGRGKWTPRLWGGGGGGGFNTGGVGWWGGGGGGGGGRGGAAGGGGGGGGGGLKTRRVAVLERLGLVFGCGVDDLEGCVILGGFGLGWIKSRLAMTRRLGLGGRRGWVVWGRKGGLERGLEVTVGSLRSKYHGVKGPRMEMVISFLVILACLS